MKTFDEAVDKILPKMPLHSDSKDIQAFERKLESFERQYPFSADIRSAEGVQQLLARESIEVSMAMLAFYMEKRDQRGLTKSATILAGVLGSFIAFGVAIGIEMEKPTD